MKNLAGHPEADTHCINELVAAGIEPVVVARYGEPHTAIAGKLGGIEFHRAWYYWIAEGRVPLDVAHRLYADPVGKQDVRVNGHCGCPAPGEPGGRPDWFDGEEQVYIDPDGTREKEYDEYIADGFLEGPKPRFQKSTEGLRGYVMEYHIDSAEGLKLFADAVRP